MSLDEIGESYIRKCLTKLFFFKGK